MHPAHIHASPVSQDVVADMQDVDIQADMQDAEMVVKPIKNRIWRTYQPSGSPHGVYAADEKMELEIGEKVDPIMDKIRARMAERGLHIKTLYLNGTVECSSTVGGADETIYLDVEDADLQKLRKLFIGAGFKTDHLNERSAYIKGSNNGTAPFQKTTARLDKHKETLKDKLFLSLTGPESAAASKRLERLHQFLDFYPQLIEKRKKFYKDQLTELRKHENNHPQRDFVQRMINYYDRALTQFSSMDKTILEMALICPVGGKDLKEATDQASKMVSELRKAIEVENGPKKDGLLTTLSKFPIVTEIPFMSSGRNNDLTMEEAIWTNQMALFAVHDPDIQKERMLYDQVQEKLRTDSFNLKLVSEKRLNLADKAVKEAAAAMPQLEAIQDTLEFAVFKFVMSDDQSVEKAIEHPHFKILWDGFPVSGNSSLPPAIIPPDESAALRQELVNGAKNNFA